MTPCSVAVIGAGSWGTAVANVFADGGAQTTIWGRDENVVKSINEKHRNSKFSPNAPLNEALFATSDLNQAIQSEILVCAIPTQSIRKVFEPLKLNGKPIVNTSKGIEEKTYQRVSEIFSQLQPQSPYLILSGPSFAKEVLQKQPTAITGASTDETLAKKIQQLFSTPYLRVYASSDVVGAEMGGALKNVVAIATGIAAGVGFGYNAQAAIINRGIAEILRMGKALGANPMTFLGLSGMGDLVLTCTGSLSRNRRLGEGLGQGKTLETVANELGGVAEGAATTRAAFELSKKLNVEMPITHQVYRILYENQPIKKALAELMNRDLTEEIDSKGG